MIGIFMLPTSNFRGEVEITKVAFKERMFVRLVRVAVALGREFAIAVATIFVSRMFDLVLRPSFFGAKLLATVTTGELDMVGLLVRQATLIRGELPTAEFTFEGGSVSGSLVGRAVLLGLKLQIAVAALKDTMLL